jgi:uncharacterized protein YecA (UPF0149 family)
MNDAGWSTLGVNGTHRYEAAAISVYWPEEQFRIREDDLAAYPDLRTVTKPLVSWPPARTATCWCGSGRSYKQCCRRHGLGTLA